MGKPPKKFSKPQKLISVSIKNVKIAFYVYPTAFQQPGGGEVQLLKTKEYLEKAGMNIKLFDPWKDHVSSFDIIHVFGSVKEALPMMEIAHAYGVKLVLSTICWYNWQAAWHTYPQFKKRALSVLRHAAKVFFPFIHSKRKRMMQIADALLPNSKSEAWQLKRFFGRKHGIYIIPNGVDKEFAEPQKVTRKVLVVCVGRIEPRKNQLKMIRALKGIGINLIFVGCSVTPHEDYYNQCREEGKEFLFLSHQNHEELKSIYASAKVFLLASHLETPGLAALEAGLAGANIVITQYGATQEYFEDMVYYVDPNNLQEIRHGVLDAIEAESNSLLKEHILKNYTWDKVAEKTIQAYEYVLME